MIENLGKNSFIEKFQSVENIMILIASRMEMSPSRFEKIVILPLAAELKFW